MKKITAIILSLAMLVGLCACGEDSNADDPNNAGYEEPTNELVGAWISYENSRSNNHNIMGSCIFNNDGTGFIYSPVFANQSFCTYTVDDENDKIYIKYDYSSETVTYTYNLNGDNLTIYCVSSYGNDCIKLTKAPNDYKCTLKNLSGVWCFIKDENNKSIYIFDDEGNIKYGWLSNGSLNLSSEDKYEIHFGIMCIYSPYSGTGKIGPCNPGYIAYYKSNDKCIVECKYSEACTYTKLSDNFSASDTELLALISKAN